MTQETCPWYRSGVFLLLGMAAFLYPCLVYYGLSHGSIRYTALVLLLLACARIASSRGAIGAWNVPVYLVLVGNLFLVLIFGSARLLLFSPVLVSLTLLCIFASSLWSPQSLIERIARILQPEIPETARQYCRTVTFVWCCFFFVNAILAGGIALFGTLELWTFYNGFLAYILVGSLLLGEYVVRKRKITRQSTVD